MPNPYQTSDRVERLASAEADIGTQTVLHRSVTMLLLICIGEAIYILPFVIARVFRPTLLNVFQLTNLELGSAFAVYGVVAMISYLPGGPLADRFESRGMMTFALLTTAIGGIAMATIPSPRILALIYGYWGLTTILLFWAPLIRATRVWGGSIQSGRAFGLLDGGRGLVAAIIGSVSVIVFASWLPEDVTTTTAAERTTAFSRVIILYSVVTAVAGLLVWICLPPEDRATGNRPVRAPMLPAMRRVLRLPTVWLQALIVMCAYVGYKGLDNVALYAHETMGFDEVQAAALSAKLLWVRPFAAIGAGLIGDRCGVSLLAAVSFVLAACGSAVVAVGLIQPGMLVGLYLTLCATSGGVYALRGLYFAIMDEGSIPMAETGAAVGIVSLVGYTPDIFIGPVIGKLLDQSPGATGHQHVFAVLSLFFMVGLIASILYRRTAARTR